MDQKRIEKLCDQYRKKADRNFRNYQETGEPRYERESRTAEEIGTHQITLGRYLNLRVSMPAELLIKAINYFDIDLCAVLGIPHEVVV